jgi:hypothetical protein
VLVSLQVEYALFPRTIALRNGQVAMTPVERLTANSSRLYGAESEQHSCRVSIPRMPPATRERKRYPRQPALAGGDYAILVWVVDQ